MTILFANSTAFAKIDNGAYLLAATAKQDNTSSQPKSEEDPAKQGHIYYNQNKYADAIKEYTKAINLENNKGANKNKETLALYYDWRAWAHYKKEDYGAAEKDFTQAINNKPDYANAYGGRAWTYKKQGEKEAAKNDFLKAANYYYNQEDYTTAKADFNNALDIDSSCAEAILNLAKIAIDVDRTYTEAIKLCTQLIEKLGNPYTPAVTYAYRAIAYNNIHEPDKAITDYKSAIREDHAYMFAYKKLAAIYFDNKKDYFNALDIYKQILELDESQKNLNDSEKQAYQKNIDTCWYALKPAEKLNIAVRYPELIGELDGLFKTFLIAIAINLVLALAYKFKTHTLTIGSAVQEILLVAILLVIVLSLDAVDDKLPFDLQETILILFVAFTLLSILENAGHLGVPIPAWLTNLLQNIINMIKRFFRLP